MTKEEFLALEKRLLKKYRSIIPPINADLLIKTEFFQTVA